MASLTNPQDWDWQPVGKTIQTQIGLPGFRVSCLEWSMAHVDVCRRRRMLRLLANQRLAKAEVCHALAPMRTTTNLLPVSALDQSQRLLHLSGSLIGRREM
jgi:hypothetical protein